MTTGLAALQTEHLDTEVVDGIGWIWLNRPPVNALNTALLDELTTAVYAARFDPAVKVAVIASRVPGFFSSGLDIAEMTTSDPNHLEQLDCRFKDTLLRLLRTARKLFAVLITGHCLGGGLELALAADLRLALRGSYQLGLPEVRLGGMPGGGGIQLLSRLVGPARALRLAALGERLDVDTAASWGLIDAVLQGDDPRASVTTYLQSVVRGPVEALGAIKLALYEGLEVPLSHALLLERELYRYLLTSSDLKEGLQAFREKRPPHFGSRAASTSTE